MTKEEFQKYEKKCKTFIFRLHCDLADNTVMLEKARQQRNIFDVDKYEDKVKYIEKLIIKANNDLL